MTPSKKSFGSFFSIEWHSKLKTVLKPFWIKWLIHIKTFLNWQRISVVPGISFGDCIVFTKSCFRAQVTIFKIFNLFIFLSIRVHTASQHYHCCLLFSERRYTRYPNIPIWKEFFPYLHLIFFPFGNYVNTCRPP